MAPSPNSRQAKSQTNQNVKTRKENQSSTSRLKSSFPLLKKYSGTRDKPFPNIFDWFAAKRQDDDIGDLWRVHDKLYDLTSFISRHPGGSDWIRVTKGTDITEAFEASHVVNVVQVETTLEKFYICPAKGPRNSPYTFREDGFYKTVKKRIEPVLKEVGIDSTSQLLLIQDGLAVTYAILALAAVRSESVLLQILAGLVLSFCVTAAHNFFHKKDSWRRFYFDLSPMSSFEWRLSHAISHHMYPNTILDYEVLMGEPLVEMLPIRKKNWVQKYGAIIYSQFLYMGFGISEVPKRILSIVNSKQKLRLENLIIFAELAIFASIASSFRVALRAWFFIFMSCSYWFILLSNHAAHHHNESFHDGDATRREPDFGLCQLDSTVQKTDWYHQNLLSVITTFGEHPMHHLFPTVCHSKLKYIKPIVIQVLKEFAEEFPYMTQWELFIGTFRQMARTTPNPIPKDSMKSK